MSDKKILIIGLVWPEPTSSAAGTRMIQLIELFISLGYQVTFASAASKSEFSYFLPQLGVLEEQIVLNDAGFNHLIALLQPHVVMFDRYMTEEQYGWRIIQECPTALRILDTEDLHLLRSARQQATKAGRAPQHADVYNEIAKREIAAILRCDLSLIISTAEMALLTAQFNIHPSLIFYLPFMEEELSATAIQQWKTFDQREGFVFIGNFLHEPNWYTLRLLKTVIWPQLRSSLPDVNMHIYGAYASQKVMQLHNPKERFLVHGRAQDARAAIAEHRVMLAPIYFGAGLKGKFIDAMQTGTPSVTTTLGAEAMMGRLDWGGALADDNDIFVSEAAALYLHKEKWSTAQKNGIAIIGQQYGKNHFSRLFTALLTDLLQNLSSHRQQNFIGQLLQHHQHNSTKYMSLWIQEKNKKKPIDE